MISSGWSPNNILVKSSRANPFSKNIPPVFLVLFWNCSGLGPEVIMIEELFFLNCFFSNLHAPHKFFGSACRVQMNLHQHSVGSMPVRFFFVYWQICISSSTGMVVEAYLWLLSSVPFLGQASWKCEKKTWLNPQNPYRRVPSCKHTKKCGKVENPTFTGYFRNGVPDGFTIYLYVYPRAWTTNFTLPPIVVGVPVVTCAYTRAEKDQPRICCMALT